MNILSLYHLARKEDTNLVYLFSSLPITSKEISAISRLPLGCCQAEQGEEGKTRAEWDWRSIYRVLFYSVVRESRQVVRERVIWQDWWCERKVDGRENKKNFINFGMGYHFQEIGENVMCQVSSICPSKFTVYSFLPCSFLHEADLIWIIYMDNLAHCLLIGQ